MVLRKLTYIKGNILTIKIVRTYHILGNCDLLLKRRSVTWNLAQPDINTRAVWRILERPVNRVCIYNSIEFSQHHLVFISGYVNIKTFFIALLLFIAPQVTVKHSIITSHWSFLQGTRIYETISCDHGLRYANGGIFVYTFCPLTYAYHYLMALIK